MPTQPYAVATSMPIDYRSLCGLSTIIERRFPQIAAGKRCQFLFTMKYNPHDVGCWNLVARIVLMLASFASIEAVAEQVPANDLIA